MGSQKAGPGPASPLPSQELREVKVKAFSPVQLSVTPWTVAHQSSPSMEFSRQEHWSGLPGDLLNSGIEPRSPALQADALPSEAPGNQSWGKSLASQSLDFFFVKMGMTAVLPYLPGSPWWQSAAPEGWARFSWCVNNIQLFVTDQEPNANGMTTCSLLWGLREGWRGWTLGAQKMQTRWQEAPAHSCEEGRAFPWSRCVFCAQGRGGPVPREGCGNLEDGTEGCLPAQQKEATTLIYSRAPAATILVSRERWNSKGCLLTAVVGIRPGSLYLNLHVRCWLLQLSRDDSYCCSHGPAEKTKTQSDLFRTMQLGKWWSTANPAHPASTSHLTFLPVKKVLDGLAAPGKQGGIGSLGKELG